MQNDTDRKGRRKGVGERDLLFFLIMKITLLKGVKN